MRILSLTNNSDLSNLLRDVLARHGYHVTAAPSAVETRRGISLVLLDEAITPGFAYLRRLRAHHAAPLLVLLRQSTADTRAASLEAGADDCLGIPFSDRELVARVRALLRRAESARSSILEANGVRMDTASRQVSCDGASIELTTLEFDVLEILLRSAGSLVSRNQLAGALYNRKAFSFDRSIDMHVSHLRRKLAPNRTLIKTVRGCGYQFCLPAASDRARQPSGDRESHGAAPPDRA